MVLGSQQAPGIRVKAEHGEIIAGHKFGSIRMRRLGMVDALCSNVRPSSLEAGEFRKTVIMIAEIAILIEREDGKFLRLVVAAPDTTARLLADAIELLRIRNGKGLQQNGMDQSEDGCRRANP